MARMNLTLTGETFTDYTTSDVGSSAFRLEHDYFTKQDLVIRTAAAGGGTLLVEGTDFTLGSEDTYLSQQVTTAVGSGRNVFLTITITNASYQTGALYFSGKYIADAVEAGDVDYRGIKELDAESYTVRDADGYGRIIVDTSAFDSTITLPTLADNEGRVIRVIKSDSGAGTVTVDGEGTEKIGVEGNALTFVLYDQGDWVELMAASTCWVVMGTSGPELDYTSTSDVAAGGTTVQTWYNPASHSLTIPAGKWDVRYDIAIQCQANTGTVSVARSCLSTANNSASDAQLVAHDASRHGSATTVYHQATQSRQKRLTLASATAYYLNIYGDTDGTITTLTTRGSIATTMIRARRIG